MVLQRDDDDGKRVLGLLTIGKVIVQTLERTDRKIPAGKYPVTKYWSPRFNRYVLLLHDVPDRTAIEVHVGNTIFDTDGCILVGRRRDVNMILESRLALEDVLNAFRPGDSMEVRNP